MTSKEALERISNIELYHKEIYEDEDFEGDWTYEETCEYDGLVCEIYKQEIDAIKQDLERLEALNKVWHDNEPMESVDINGKHLQELYNYINKLQQENEILKMTVNDTYDSANDIIFELQEIGSNLKQENEKLKKAIEILKEHNLTISYIPDITRPHLTLNDYGDGVTLDIKEYKLLKEVLE